MKSFSFSNLLRSLIQFYSAFSSFLLPRRFLLWLTLFLAAVSLAFIIFSKLFFNNSFYALLSISITLWAFWMLALTYLFNDLQIRSLKEGSLLSRMTNFIRNLYIHILSLIMTSLGFLAIVMTLRAFSILL